MCLGVWNSRVEGTSHAGACRGDWRCAPGRKETTAESVVGSAVVHLLGFYLTGSGTLSAIG